MFDEPLEVSNNIIWMKGKDFLFPMESTKPCGEEFQYIDIDSIDNKNNIINKKIIKSTNAPSRASRKTYPTSTLFSMVRPYLRNIAFVGEENVNAIASTGFFVCTPMPFVNPEYLFILMTSKYVVDGLNYFMKGDNSPSIIKGDIEKFLFPIPSLEYQNKVLGLLEKIMPKLNVLRNSQEELVNVVKVTKRKILDDIFSENSSYKSYYENKIPITDDVEILDYLRKPINTSERLERLSNATNTYPYYGATGQTGLIDDYLIDGEYVLLGEDGAPFLDKNSLKAYLINGKSWINNHVHILKSKTNNKFLMYYLNWFNYYDYVTGTTRLKLNQGMLKKILIPNIPAEIKGRIVSQIENAFYILESII